MFEKKEEGAVKEKEEKELDADEEEQAKCEKGARDQDLRQKVKREQGAAAKKLDADEEEQGEPAAKVQRINEPARAPPPAQGQPLQLRPADAIAAVIAELGVVAPPAGTLNANLRWAEVQVFGKVQEGKGNPRVENLKRMAGVPVAQPRKQSLLGRVVAVLDLVGVVQPPPGSSFKDSLEYAEMNLLGGADKSRPFPRRVQELEGMWEGD